jgi:hypothetical protein
MRKSFLFVIFICLLSSVAYSQDSTLNVVKFLDNIRGDVRDGVTAIAEYIKQVSPFLYEATKQKIVATAWVAIISCIHFPIIFIITLIGIRYRWDDEGMAGLFIFSVVSFAISLFVCIHFIPQILAPDYYTIEALIGFIK